MFRGGCLAGLLLCPALASAGREPFNEVLDNEVLPARVVELETRVTDIVGTPDGSDETGIVWGASFGLSHRVELLLPAEVAYSHADGTTQFTWYAADVRWRMAKPGPPPGPGHVVPLLRAYVERAVVDQDFEGGADLVLGSDLSKRVHAAAMVGGGAVSTGADAWLHGGIGVTANASDALRLGGEAWTEGSLLSGGGPSLSAGPDLSYTLGAFWITGGGLFGLGSGRAYTTSVRISWGVEL